jgi:hypothetical protein
LEYYGAVKFVSLTARYVSNDAYIQLYQHGTRCERQVLAVNLDYYHPWRTHQSLNNNAPDGRPVRAAQPWSIVEFPAVNGLHHVYLPKAA